MAMPGTAPFTPAIHPPSPTTQLLAPSQSNVSSPKYQTFPLLSCAKWSNVSSVSAEGSVVQVSPSKMESWITSVVTPSITRVACVTTNRSTSQPSLVSALNV